MEQSETTQKLIDIMERLRDPENGCPWDLKQNFKTIAPYTIEEAYEVADAIEQNDMTALRDELGDLLLQVVFHAQMAKEEGHFEYKDVVQSISDKMIVRHPHVFEENSSVNTAEDVLAQWEDIKEQERKDKKSQEGVQTNSLESGALDGITKGLPSLLRAYKMQSRCARVGFEWADIDGVMEKVGEEFEELCEEMENNEDGSNTARVSEEFGDLLFVLSDLARWQGFDPEESLRASCYKFERRFRGVEAKLAKRGKTHKDTDLEEMDLLWNQVKAEENKA